MHNNKLKTTAAVVAASLLLGAQSVGAISFADEYEYKWSTNTGTESAESFFGVTATDGGYVAVGAAYNEDAQAGNAYIVKYNVDGTVAWENKVGANGNCGNNCEESWYMSVLAVSDGYIAVGTSGYTSYSDAPWYKASAENLMLDGVIVKYNLDGTVAWGEKFDNDGYDDYFHNAALLENGKVVVAGSTIDANSPHTNALVALYDTDGTMEWYTDLGGSADEEYFGVTVAEQGIIATGTSDSADGPWENDNGNVVGIVTAFDLDGNDMGTLVDDLGNDPTVEYGRVTASNDKFFVINNGDEIVMYDLESGDLLDGVAIESAYANDIEVVEDGFITVGTYERDYGYEPIITKYDFAGKQIWTHELSNEGSEEGGVFNAMAINGDTLVAVGDSYTNNQPYWSNNGESDGVIAVFSLPEDDAPGVPSTGIVSDQSEGAALGAALSIAIGAGAVVATGVGVAMHRKAHKVTLRK